MTPASAQPASDRRTEYRLAGLDVLRGGAILLVVAGHFLPGYVLHGRSGDLVYGCGEAGVILFFFLSGFLIYRNVQRYPFGIFLSRRLFKIFPAYWVNILVILVLARGLAQDLPRDWLTIASNLLMVQEFTHVPLLNGTYWTLQVEVKFYLLIAIFQMLIGVRRIYWLLGAVVAANFALLPMIHHGSTFLTNLVAFFPGIAAARAWDGGWSRKAYLEIAAVTGVTAIDLLVFLNINNAEQAVCAMVFGLLLILALRRGWSNGVMRFFGRISYSHYLYHGALGFTVFALVQPFASPLAAWGWAGAIFAGTTLAAWLSYHLVERPGVALGHRLERRFLAWRPDPKLAAARLGGS